MKIFLVFLAGFWQYLTCICSLTTREEKRGTTFIDCLYFLYSQFSIPAAPQETVGEAGIEPGTTALQSCKTQLTVTIEPPYRYFYSSAMCQGKVQGNQRHSKASRRNMEMNLSGLKGLYNEN
jgi:hypothetical protein